MTHDTLLLLIGDFIAIMTLLVTIYFGRKG